MIGDDAAEDAKMAAALRPKLTPEFLATLDEAIRVCGWSVDMIETERFRAWCHSVAVGRSR